MGAVQKISLLLYVLALTGCGAAPPPIAERGDPDLPKGALLDEFPISATAQLEFEVKKAIFCELKRAVQAAERPHYQNSTTNAAYSDRAHFLPLDWGAQVSLLMQADESVSLNPGLSLTSPLNAAETFGVAAGASVSSAAMRQDKFDSFYTIAHLAKPTPDDGLCNRDRPGNDPIVHAGYAPPTDSYFIESDLGLKEWLLGALYATRAIPSDLPFTLSQQGGKLAAKKAAAPGKPPDTITIEIKFVVTSSGGVTPSLKLVRFAANASTASLFGGSRMRTHDAIITIGPLTARTEQIHLQQQLGAAVSASLLPGR